MRHFIPTVIGTILFATCFGSCVGVYSQTKPARVASASASGHVVIHGKNAPSIVVSMRTFQESTPVPSGKIYKAVTDQDGNYRIADVPAGHYLIRPVAPTYVAVQTKAIFLNDGEDVHNIDFSLVQGGVVTGRITDSDGRELIEERVYLMAVNQTNSSPTYSGSEGITDDRGIYRMFGVAPGLYRVAVGTNDQRPFEGIGSGRQIYKQTFYPSVSDPAKATVIEVGEGTETTNVDIAVGRAEQTYAAAGRLIDGVTGEPVPNVRIGVTAFIGDSSFSGSNAQTNSKGEFTVENLMPGKYALIVFPQLQTDLYTEPLPFEIIDQNISGLVLKKENGASVSGVVALEGSASKEVLALIPKLRLQVYVQTDGPTPRLGQFLQIKPDLSFRVGGLHAGKAYFALAWMDRNTVKGMTVQRIEKDGVGQMAGLEIKPGEQLGGVKIVLSYGNARIRGAVDFINGTLPQSGRLVIQLRKQDELKNFGRQVEVDARGRFIAEGLTAGVYEVTATAYWQDQRTRPPSSHQEISLSESATADVTLVLDLKSDEQPKP